MYYVSTPKEERGIDHNTNGKIHVCVNKFKRLKIVTKYMKRGVTSTIHYTE